MQKIWQNLGKVAPVKGDIGIEIEAEGKNLVPVDSAAWKTENDGSLRGRFPDECCEFVLTKPVSISKVKEVLTELKKAQEAATLNFSFRTSVHIHMNVQELTHLQLINLVYTYLLLEEPLLSFCGKERKANRFCLRLQDAEGFMEHFSYLIQNTLRDFRLVNENSIRYAALNLAAINKYGSVEFRSMRGTLEVGVLQDWVSALVQIKNYACQAESPAAIFKEFCQLGCLPFLNKVLGVYADKFTYPNVEKDMQRSFSLSIDVPFLYKQVAHKFKEQLSEAPEKDKKKSSMKIIHDELVQVPELERMIQEEDLRRRMRNAAAAIRPNFL